MKELTVEQIEHNWKKLRNIVQDTFEGERLEGLNEMYDYFEERMCLAPASGKEHFHNAHPGGYVEHVLHITDLVQQLHVVWSKNGATVDNFTVEELIFAALHHDLGKVGNLVEDNYIHNESDWHRKNQGMIYKHNPRIEYMTITDRAIWILQHFGIKMTENEYIGLRLTDGMYEEANKSYYVAYQPERQLKSNIAYILHQADMMASHIEYDEWKRGDHAAVIAKKEETKEKTEQSKVANQAFKELFGE
tara:strand:- start:4000 stop:4743 length:744 start_codon:yes stop_codon:yes gene_type:complete